MEKRRVCVEDSRGTIEGVQGDEEGQRRSQRRKSEGDVEK